MNRHLNLAVYLVFGILLLSFFDSCSGLIESRTQFRLVRGVPRPLSGDLDSGAKDLERLAGVKETDDLSRYLAYETNGPLFLRFTGLQGRLWRGDLSAPSSADPGEYHLTVYQKDVHHKGETSLLKVILYPDMDAYMKDLPSITERLFGFQPWWITLAALPLAMLLLYLSYWQSGKDEILLRAQGLGTIFKLAYRPDGWSMAFNLGARDGLSQGDTLYLLDKKGRMVASFTPDKVEHDYSLAELPLSTPVKANCIVSVKAVPQPGSQE